MEKKNMVCPYCGGTEFVEAVANRPEASVRNLDLVFKATHLWYTVCLTCGTVVRSYVENVEELRPKKEKERREEGPIERKLKDFFLYREPEETESVGSVETVQRNREKTKSNKEPWE